MAAWTISRCNVPARVVVAVGMSVCISCQPNTVRRDTETKTISTSEFTDSDACKALLEDLKFPDDSLIGKALKEETFVRSSSGECMIESRSEGQLLFNVKAGDFTIIHGVDKGGGRHKRFGLFYVSEKGTLRAKLGGQSY